MLRDELRTTGVWYFTDRMAAGEAAEFAQRIESLGYSALWLPDTVGRDPFAHIAYLASRTSSLVFATGIASIFHRHPGPMKQVAMTLGEQTGDRFVLGLGVSHAPMVAGLRRLDYSKPLTQMREYLQAMDAAPYGARSGATPPRLLAALGPKMLELSRDAADGAHPYWTTPEHTAEARSILGPDKLLCVEQKVVVTTDAGGARSAARAAVDVYANLPNYRNNWKRLGFGDDEIDARADRFLDAVVAWGDEAAVRRRVQDHYDAGADHVCVQPLSPEGFGELHWPTLEALAPGS
ncbi:MAG TPA: TIGR03620 family F420-dependent LLM class oxidoreductase [Acidimicrobiales bacterium]|nr:TIGR03620 family F420-dependent LLM class oxidoreductase [Acidimicrobiales bacterium]